MKRRLLPFLLALVVLLVPGTNEVRATQPAFVPSASVQAFVRTSAESISVAELRDFLSFISSDEMEGRLTPSRGLDTTAKFIATMLSRWGVTPAGGGGSYLQKFDLRKEKVDPAHCEVELSGARMAYGKDYIASAFPGHASGKLVYAGSGWFVKAKHIDAYSGVDPKGKIVIINHTSALPGGLSPDDLAGGKRGEDWIDPIPYARKKGAAGIVLLISRQSQAGADVLEGLRERVEGGGFYPEKLPGGSAERLPTVLATSSMAEALFAGQKTSAAEILDSFTTSTAGGNQQKSFELTADRTLRFSVATSEERATTQNVVATIEGSDPVLKNEYVALGAHYDHLGVGRPVNGDAIRNGADDDGTGTTALLAIADALMHAPRRPKRSVLLVWHAGEEEGLWGSQYFTTYPTVPLNKVVTQLNIDMIGRSRPAGDNDRRDRDLSGPDELYVIGSKKMSTELGEMSEAVNNSYLKLSFNYKYDDPNDPEQFFYRSDHINYARNNIPIIFYFTGVHRDYHQPGDEVSKIDFGKYDRIVRTIYLMMWEVGEMKERPKVDKPLSVPVTIPES